MNELAASTIALSVHNAIVAIGRPASVREIRRVLAQEDFQFGPRDIEVALFNLVARGHVRLSSGVADTVRRNAKGKRVMIKKRDRNQERNPEGWF